MNKVNQSPSRFQTQGKAMCRLKVAPKEMRTAALLVLLRTLEYPPHSRLALKSQDARDDLRPHERGQRPPDSVQRHGPAPAKLHHPHAHGVGGPHGDHGEFPIESTHDDPVHGIGQSLEDLRGQHRRKDRLARLPHGEIVRQSSQYPLPLQVRRPRQSSRDQTTDAYRSLDEESHGRGAHFRGAGFGIGQFSRQQRLHRDGDRLADLGGRESELKGEIVRGRGDRTEHGRLSRAHRIRQNLPQRPEQHVTPRLQILPQSLPQTPYLPDEIHLHPPIQRPQQRDQRDVLGQRRAGGGAARSEPERKDK
mmetsp:Transcript_19010/g.55181  ORF Transcript_19010/g.55181 Transcript_19010/m.55181 type:complete len:307 (+) Transcript_19010:99-1019(+)